MDVCAVVGLNIATVLPSQSKRLPPSFPFQERHAVDSDSLESVQKVGSRKVCLVGIARRSSGLEDVKFIIHLID